MIEFQCPGCLNVHAANAAFAGLRARCIVCGAIIRVPAKGGGKAELAEEPGAPRSSGIRTRLAPSKPPQPSRPMGARSTVSAPDLELEDEALDTPVTPTGRAGARPATLAPDDPETDAIDLADSDTHDAEDAPEPAKEPRPEPPLPAVDPQTRRKNLKRLGVAGGLVVIIVVCGIVFFSGGKKPTPTPPPRQDDTAAKAPKAPEPQQPVPLPKPPEKKAEPPKAPAVEAPPPHLAGEAVVFASATLVAERAAAPQGFDRTLEGRRVIVQGTFARFDGQVLVLADSPEDARNAVFCTLPKWVLADLKLQPGQATVVAGVYARDLQLHNCEVLRTTLPTDEEFKDRVVEVTGVVQQVQKDGGAAERFPTLFLTPPTTDPLISVRCLFRLSESEKLAKLKVGQTVTVRGRCEGRLFRVVRFHDCALADPADPPVPGLVRVAADKFFAAYETDLLPVPRPGPDAVPIVATAEQLAEAFATDPVRASAAYRHKLVQVSGKILSRRSNTVLLETGTGHRFQMELVFTPAKFALLRDEAVLTARGVCTGVRGGYVHFENCERFDADLGNAAVRTTVEYFPLDTGRELIYDVLTPRQARDNPITQYSVRFIEGDTVRTTPLRAGTFPKATLFGDPAQPKWNSSAKLKSATNAQVRLNEGTIEVRDKPAPPAQPGSWWDPMLKIGMGKGEKWSSAMPDGRTVTYTVAGFGRDASGRNTVEITRVVKNPRDPKEAAWEEATITYARGVGEVRRVITHQSAAGKGFTVLEMRLVEPESPNDVPPKKEPNPPPAESKDVK